MKESKFIGNIYEGRWKVVEYANPKYILENIYNGNKLEIYKTSFIKLKDGKTTVSKILCYRANKSKRNDPRAIRQITTRAARRTIYAIRKERGTLND